METAVGARVLNQVHQAAVAQAAVAQAQIAALEVVVEPTQAEAVAEQLEVLEEMEEAESFYFVI